MKKILFAGFLLVLLVSLTSLASHKFYVSIFQVNYALEKKELQITSRIFVDDLNNTLRKKYNKDFHLGEKEETPEELALMQQYFASHFTIDVDRKQKSMQFISKEMENNVLICYFKIPDVPKFTYLGITNKMLFDFVTEQQNIIQITIYGKKSSLLLTIDEPSNTLKFPTPVY